MGSWRAARAVTAAATVAAVGCVERRFVIESNVPTAQVYVDGRPVGAAPADVRFDYYGYYTITLVHPGFETKTERVRVKPAWHAYPPLDFVAEVLWPFHIEDVRRYYFEMSPARQVLTPELLQQADELRGRGQTLPPPKYPQESTIPGPPAGVVPATSPLPAPAGSPSALPQPSPLPADGPVPQGVPSVRPPDAGPGGQGFRY